MNKKRSMLVLILTILTSISFASTVYVSALTLMTTTVAQAQPLWCWAACAENAIRWEMSPSRNQWDAVRKIKGSVFNPYPNEGGSIQDTIAAAEYISNGTKDYDGRESRLSFDELYQDLDVYSNYIILGVKNSIGVGHMVSMMAGDKSTNAVGFIDPNDNKYYSCTYSSLCDGSYNGRRYVATVYNTGY